MPEVAFRHAENLVKVGDRVEGYFDEVEEVADE